MTTFRAVGDTWSQVHVYSRIGDLQADHGNQRAVHKASSAAAAELLNGNTNPTPPTSDPSDRPLALQMSRFYRFRDGTARRQRIAPARYSADALKSSVLSIAISGDPVAGMEAPVIGWLLTKLGPGKAWLERQLNADHAPITGRQGRPDHLYHGFFLFVAVAPSHSPDPLPVPDFIDRAHDFVQQAFPTVFPEISDYDGSELVRYRSPVVGTEEEHIITIRPTGLVELHWLLAVPPTTALALSDIIEPLQTLHRVIQAGGLAELYQPRRFEGRRRLDWSIGISGRASPRNGGNSVSWTNVTAPIKPPEQRNRAPRPYCPPDGYAARQLTSLSQRAELEDLLKPALEEHLAVGGYGDSGMIRDFLTDLARHVRELDDLGDRNALN